LFRAAKLIDLIGICRDNNTKQILYNGEWRLGYRHGYGEATLFGGMVQLIGEIIENQCL